MNLTGWLFFGLLLSFSDVLAQTATLNGTTSDESGALVPGAKIMLTGMDGSTKSVTSSPDGSYAFTNLSPGTYAVQATAPQLATQPVRIAIRPGPPQSLNLQLKIVSALQEVNVQSDTGPAISTEAAGNANALVLRGSDLDALADDTEDLAADLQALAGPAAGPGGGATFIDGFSGGELPQKNSIREIRINQNPFSPEYDKLGFGRIEIFTKPGAGALHGNVFFNFTNSVMDSRNPFASQKAPLQNTAGGGNLSGPINKRASFTLDAQQNFVYNGSVVDAVTLDQATLSPSPFDSIVKTRQKRSRVTPRADYQLNANNTLTFRYAWTRSDIQDAGIGGFDLFSRGYHFENINQTVQVTETAILGAAVNETRLQYFRSANQTSANSDAPEISVSGSFNGGGAQTGLASDIQNNFELQNYSIVTHGAHVLTFGVRVRGQIENNISPTNFGGTFTFTGGLAPELDGNNQEILGSNGLPEMAQISSIEQYRRTLVFEEFGYTPAAIRMLGGGASQYSISTGNPAIAGSQIDAAEFVGDEWRVRPNFNISLGLRYESQTNIHDRKDFAPRLAFAWAPGGRKNSRPMIVLRGGFGMFYDRFGLFNTLTAERFNGITEQQYVVSNPDFFPTVPPPSSLAGLQSEQVIQEVDAHLRAPYLMQTAFTAERQLPKNTTLALTYSNSHGLHELRSLDINPPPPGTQTTVNPIFLMTSSGLYKQNQMFVNVNSRINAAASLFGFYSLNYAISNTEGLGTFPANPYNWAGEYGRASTDIRNRFTFGGSLYMRWNILVSPLLIIQSGAPFNITTGGDLYGTTLFNARPGIAANPNTPGAIQTVYGLLDPNPTPGEQIIPRNDGRGPGQITLNVRFAKTWGFGPEKGGTRASAAGGSPIGTGPPEGGSRSIFGSSSSGRRYDLTLSLTARNLLNHLNPGAITGNITSPLFGQANSLNSGPTGPGVFSENANNRRLEWQLRFAF
ncbi:MAG: carboxypeptidase-like regulatory domain-containing protein [Bryobacteraceae bacterium]|jgi:hypothetical protein